MSDPAAPGTTPPVAAPAAAAPPPAAPAAAAPPPAAPAAAQVAGVVAAAGPGLQVPDYLKQMQGAGTNTAVDSMASAAMSIPRVSMRGKKFRFIEGGEEVFTVNDKVEVVIMGVEPDTGHMIKTFYKDKYGGANVANPPDCASDDGIRPSGWIANPQNANCAECPQNRFGSATSRQGKPAKACRDSKRLWVVRRADIGKETKPVMYALGVTVMSLKSLSEFGREMKGLNVPISSAITEVTMDDDSEFPMISFKCIGFLPEVDAKACIARGAEAEWKLNYTTAPRITAQPVSTAGLPAQVAAMAGAGAGATIENAATPAATPVPAKSADMNDIVKNW